MAAPSSIQTLDQDQQALLAAVRDVIADRGLAFNTVRRLLAQGLNPDFSQSQDASPLLMICKALHRQPERTLTQQLLALLIEHGANPLGGEAALNETMLQQDPYLSLRVIEAMGQAERAGRPLRGDDGGNPFHLLCVINPEWFEHALDHWHTDELFSGDGRVRGERIRWPTAWRDEALPVSGHTPLHLLWQNMVSLGRCGDGARPHLVRGWATTESMARKGAVLDLADAQGRTVAGLIMIGVSEGLAVAPDSLAWKQTRAVCEAERLNAHTPAAAGGIRSTRL